MAEEKLLTIRDVSLILGISEREVIDLAEEGKIPAYKVGGVYLRFKPQQIEEFKKSFFASKHRSKRAQKYPFNERFSDFFYFNDFYILCFFLIVLISIIIFKGC